MRMIFYAVLILGLGLAGGAVYLANGYIGNFQNELAQAKAAQGNRVELVEVLVAAEPLRYGDRITAEHIRAVRWPQDAVPEGAFTATEDLFSKGENMLRTAIRAMEKDEVLMAVKVTEPGEDAGVSSRLTRGMRAFAIKVDVSTGVSGFLRPGDRVDVYWTGKTADKSRGNSGVTKLIESAVRLIAIDQQADGDSNNPTIARTVTVEASPHQVAGLAQAQSTGKLSLALVGAEDDSVVGSVEIDQNELLGIVEAELAEIAPEPEVCTIRTRRGGQTVETPIPCTN